MYRMCSLSGLNVVGLVPDFERVRLRVEDVLVERNQLVFTAGRVRVCVRVCVCVRVRV